MAGEGSKIAWLLRKYSEENIKFIYKKDKHVWEDDFFYILSKVLKLIENNELYNKCHCKEL